MDCCSKWEVWWGAGGRGRVEGLQYACVPGTKGFQLFFVVS